MMLWDETWAAATHAATAEAQRLGASAHGSEHALLGLLVSDDAVTRRVVRRAPGLTVEAVRSAVLEGIDDAPHLAALGLDPGRPGNGVHASAAGQPVMLRNRQTAELQAASSAATSTWMRLVKRGLLPRQKKLGSAQLWLAVLEPTTRSARLLRALGEEPAQLRAEVLAAMTPVGGPVPEWPADSRPGFIARLVRRVFERLTVAR